MTRLFLFILLLQFSSSFGQTPTTQKCKMEFYLLKSRKPNLNPAIGISGQFWVNKTDLQDTPFIKDVEILGCTYEKDTVKYNDSSLITIKQIFKIAATVAPRIRNIEIPLCCGRQFALVVNGEIVYSGYFWNTLSSFGCNTITAFVYGTTIQVVRKLPDYNNVTDSTDPRQNQLLYDCLTRSNRLLK